MTNKQIFALLAARARARPGVDAEDAAQAALARALADDRELRGKALLARAEHHLTSILRRTRWDRRRGHAVASGDASSEGKTFEPVRRLQGSKRRLPKGAAGVHTYDAGFHVIPRDEDGDEADERLRFAASHLIQVDLPRLIHREPYPRPFHEAILAAYRAVYGVEPEFHWAHVLVEEVAHAKLQQKRNSHPEAKAPPPTKTEVTLVPARGPGARGKGTRHEAEAVLIPTVPGRAIRQLYATIDGEKRLLGTELLTQEPELEYPEDPMTQSTMILNVVRLRLAQLAVPQRVPAYAENTLLVRWLLTRLGFDGGGGRDMVKRETLLAWLTNPVELAAQIERYSRRRSKGGTAAQGRAIKAELAKLAGEIRAQSPG